MRAMMLNRRPHSKTKVVHDSDGFRYMLLSYDIMQRKGERYYMTVDLKLKLHPEIVDGKLEWVIQEEDVQKGLIEKCPSMATRKDLVALPV